MTRLSLPTTVVEAVDMLSADDAARPIAGGVGLSLRLATGAPILDHLVAVGHLDELRGIGLDGGETTIGAAVTLAELADPRRTEVPPLLRAAALSIANPGVRAAATVGGNLVAGADASDLLAACLALDGRWVTAAGTDRDGSLTAGMADVGLLRGIRCRSGADGWGWQRLTIRGAMDRSCATVAVAVAGHGLRVALTVASVRALRLTAVESIDDPRHARAAAIADLEGVELRTDDRASHAYRRRVIPVLVERAVAAALVSA